MSEKYVRVFRSAKVDHLSLPRTKDGDWAPICGQRSDHPWVREFGDQPYPGTHLCVRCEALSEASR